MLLQTKSCSSFSPKYNPLQHACQKGLVNRSHHRMISNKDYSIKCSIRSSFYLTNINNNIGKNINNEEIINRNQNLFNKSSIIPSASLQDDYGSKSKDDNINIIGSVSIVDTLIKKLDALYRFSRPYAWTSVILGIISISLLPVESLAELTPSFIIQVLLAIVPTIVMNIFVAAINELSDIEIDKVNKPYLPLASGDLSVGEGIALSVISSLMSVAIAIMLRSPPIVVAVIIRWIVGAAYSINLPFLRWKGKPLMAAITILFTNGILIHFPYFIHAQKYLLGKRLVFTKTFLFAAAFMGLLNIAIAFLKDIPDVEGDKEFGVQTLPVVLGKEKVFSLSLNILYIAYGGAVLVGASSSSLLCKLVSMTGHFALGLLLWRHAQTVDLSDPKSTYAFFIFIFQLFYAENFLIHFVR